MTPLIPKTRFFPESARREPPPPRRCSDGSLLSEDEEGNSNRLMVGDKNSRTRPYYLRRCKRVRPTNIESLPSELLSDILVRLSADHLYDRVRLACLRWYHIIHSYDFVNAQIQHSTCGLLLCCREVWGGHHPILITATQGGRIETSEFTYLYRGMLINCCNGLCLETYCRRRIPYIINPATKQSFIIPSVGGRQGDNPFLFCFYFLLFPFAFCSESRKGRESVSEYSLLASDIKERAERAVREKQRDWV
ncbi:uncharacterized protein LOC131012328 [Salvia miltiorrhiza]|uniref:uncharacterized protein LOC131012328 n=1 Tax=Salvia miltiorrhiza TaxID=226208 RepID=UPI0025ACFAD3|nr:uncharacterized protein LOC131012328 [Salvia miltiorrhiza]